jgi:hypothetical protein
MANAGIGVSMGQPDAPFWQALDQAALQGAFQDILDAPRPCKFALDMPLDPAQAGTCTVEVNGTAVPLDPVDGWDPGDATHIDLHGAACDSIQMGTVDISMQCDCDAVGGP